LIIAGFKVTTSVIDNYQSKSKNTGKMRYVSSTTFISDFVEDAFPQHLGLLLLLLLLLLLTVSFIVQHTL
jgi:hypothetical protein